MNPAKAGQHAHSGSRNLLVLAVLSLVFSGRFTCGALVPLLNPGLSAFRSSKPWRKGGREDTLRHLRQALVLTERQAREVETELDEIAKVYGDLQSQMDDLRQDSRDRIMRMLTLEQQKKLEILAAQTRARPLHRPPLGSVEEAQGGR